jgi:hypothetical protein
MRGEGDLYAGEMHHADCGAAHTVKKIGILPNVQGLALPYETILTIIS